MPKKETSKEKFTSAEKRAYYMGYGAARCGLTITSENVQKMIGSCKDDKTTLSMTRGVLDGSYPRRKGEKRSPNK